MIPAYEPGPELPHLVARLVHARPSIEVLVVDDGSGPASRETFAACASLGGVVLRLERNRGKGFALRAGFAALIELGARGPVVTADADGQHAVEDVLAVMDAVLDTPDAAPHLVLGERALDVDVPLRSRVGNGATRLLFRAATGRAVHDTQTGLRGFPASLLPWLMQVPGDRYEYELVMLLRAARRHVPIHSVAIRTIYLDDNSSSHFRPLVDSARIYAPLLAFLASSLAAFVIDVSVFLVLHAALGAVLPAVVGARLVSATVNFAVNRRLVFGDARARRRSAAVRYAALAAGLLLANFLLLSTLYSAGVPLLVAKLLTELVLVAASFVVQARYVFDDDAAGQRTRARARRPVRGRRGASSTTRHVRPSPGKAASRSAAQVAAASATPVGSA